MCGICGIVDLDRGVDETLLGRMTEIMTHRGPDAGGIWISADRGIGLGHRRLSIIDTDPRSNQPFSTLDGRLVVTFNGEIYNYLELRESLEDRGYRFRTESDTEVLLHAYDEWDLACVDRLRGMFAFAVVDLPRRRVWLVRDRLGKKPLLYYQKGSCLAFASEFQAFTQAGDFDLSIDLSALYDCLTYLFIPAPKSAFRHIRKLEAGHWLLWENGAVRDHAYWDVREFGTQELDEAAAVARLRERLEEAVRLRMRADVPLGILLSGGVDSSAVTRFALSCCANPVWTFSVGFDDPTRSELPFAELLAQRVGSQHTSCLCTIEAARAGTSQAIDLYGEPHGDSSIFPQTVVSQLARQSVTVALGGDGGDEVFGGYTRYGNFEHYDGHHHYPLRDMARRALESGLPFTTRGRNRLLRYHTDGWDLYTILQDGLTRLTKRQLLAPDVYDAFADYDEYWAYRMYWRDDVPLASRLQYMDLKTYLAEDILMKVDRASMAVALEVRAPLLDHQLVEEVFSWPDHIRNSGHSLKYIFKKAMTGLLPPQILERPKQGFSIPWRTWERDWTELGTLRGDGQFFRKDKALPAHYTLRMMQHWLNHHTPGAHGS